MSSRHRPAMAGPIGHFRGPGQARPGHRSILLRRRYRDEMRPQLGIRRRKAKRLGKDRRQSLNRPEGCPPPRPGACLQRRALSPLSVRAKMPVETRGGSSPDRLPVPGLCRPEPRLGFLSWANRVLGSASIPADRPLFRAVAQSRTSSPSTRNIGTPLPHPCHPLGRLHGYRSGHPFRTRCRRGSDQRQMRAIRSGSACRSSRQGPSGLRANSPGVFGRRHKCTKTAAAITFFSACHSPFSGQQGAKTRDSTLPSTAAACWSEGDRRDGARRIAAIPGQFWTSSASVSRKPARNATLRSAHFQQLRARA